MTVTRIPAVRSAPGSTGTTVRRAEYQVFLVQLAPFPNDRNQRDSIRTGVSNRLVELFAAVADASGPPRTINLVWVDTLAELIAENPHPREVVVYFTESFQRGLIAPYLQSLSRRARPTSRDGFRDLYDRFNRQPPAEVGLTVEGSYEATVGRRREVMWQYSEVFVRATYETFQDRNADISNVQQYMQDTVGYGIAGLVYHELMHNKVDPPEVARDRNWDLHNGTGLARISGYRDAHTQANITKLAQYLNAASPVQYVPGLSADMPGALPLGLGEAPREADESGGGGGGGGEPDLSGLDGL
jgi:hypothetical protein